MRVLLCAACLLAGSLADVFLAKEKKGDESLDKAVQKKEKDGSLDGTVQKKGKPKVELGGSFGTGVMARQYMVYHGMPIGEEALWAAGWTRHEANGCDPDLGFAWTEEAAGPTREKPMKLYTTAGGQPAGIGVIVLGHGYPALPGPQQQWATQEPLVEAVLDEADGEHAHIDIAFRSGEIMCSGKQGDAKLGDELIVNPKGVSKSIPLQEDENQTVQDGWHRGSCFDHMGWHRIFDTSQELSWKADNIFPIIPMYFKGEVSTILFSSPFKQQSNDTAAEANTWDPTSLANEEFCANFCNAECTFDSPSRWSTLHVFFGDHDKVVCEQGLTCNLPPQFDRGACCAA